MDMLHNPSDDLLLNKSHRTYTLAPAGPTIVSGKYRMPVKIGRAPIQGFSSYLDSNKTSAAASVAPPITPCAPKLMLCVPLPLQLETIDD
jgi:hypothetical protein